MLDYSDPHFIVTDRTDVDTNPWFSMRLELREAPAQLFEGSVHPVSDQPFRNPYVAGAH
ncbi:MAG: hypothetical protein OXG42_10480 [Chloroflexi bacterium]|nr:hypothetical protein [Chloroflexota bacterium]